MFFESVLSNAAQVAETNSPTAATGRARSNLGNLARVLTRIVAPSFGSVKIIDSRVVGDCPID